MRSYFYEDNEGAGVNIDAGDADIEANRRGKEIHLRISRHCEGIHSTICVDLTCEEYARLLCELGRVKCGHRACCDEREAEIVVNVFDQDNCDEPPKRKIATTKGGK